MAIYTSLTKKGFTPSEKESIKSDLENITDLAWLMISDDGELEPGCEEQAAAIQRIRDFIKDI